MKSGNRKFDEVKLQKDFDSFVIAEGAKSGDFAQLGHYIFKPPSDKFPEMSHNEHLTMRIAETFGIRVVPSSLIQLSRENYPI